MLGYEFLIIILMLFFNAVFAAYEMGLASISKARLAVLADTQKKGAAEALYMKSHMEVALTVIQLGITLVSAIAAATGGVGIGERFAPSLEVIFNIPELAAKILAVIIFIIPLTFIIIVFAELVPKMIALHNKEWIVLKLSPQMKAISSLFAPFISVVEKVVKKVVGFLVMFSPKELSSKGQDLHELKAAVSLARTAKILGAREEHIVLSAASFTVRQVKDIVIPIQDVSMIYAGNSLTDALLKAHRDMHTRFPVCTKEGDPQTIEGYINFKDIITVLKINPQNPSLSQIVRPIKKVSEDMVISQLLEVMIQEKIHIVLVVSLKEKVLGIVTLEDIIEELTGDIESEFDRLPTYIHPCGTASWIMGGGVPMTLVASTLGLNWEGKLIAKAEPVPETKAAAAGVNVPKVPTLNEWCKHKAHKKLIGGEIIEVEGLRIVPRKFRRKKLYEAAVSLALVSDKG